MLSVFTYLYYFFRLVRAWTKILDLKCWKRNGLKAKIVSTLAAIVASLPFKLVQFFFYFLDICSRGCGFWKVQVLGFSSIVHFIVKWYAFHVCFAAQKFNCRSILGIDIDSSKILPTLLMFVCCKYDLSRNDSYFTVFINSWVLICSACSRECDVVLICILVGFWN